MAVFYRKSRLEPMAFDHFWLSDTPEVIGSTTWGNTNRRMVTWVRFKDRADGREFYFWNTHLDHQIQAAREKGHWAVVVMAANGKDDPAEAPRLIEALESGYDYVQGSRYLASGGASINLPLGRSIMIRGYTLLFRLLSGFRVSDVTNGFRAYRLDLFDDPRIRIDQSWLDRYELEYYIHWKVVTLGYRVIEVGVSKTYPTGGGNYSKIRRVRDWWSIVRPTILLWLHLRS